MQSSVTMEKCETNQLRKNKANSFMGNHDMEGDCTVYDIMSRENII